MLDFFSDILLVLYEKRPAYLYEITNSGIDLYLKIVDNLSDYFHFTVEYIIDDKIWRIFIHTKPLFDKERYTKHDYWVADCLGFIYQGIPDSGIVLNYLCDDVNLTTQIIPHDMIDDERIEFTREEFDEILPCNVTISPFIKHDEDLYLDFYENKEYEPIIEYLEGCGVEYEDNKIDEEVLWFDLCLWYIGIFDDFFPINNKESHIFDLLYKNIKNNQNLILGFLIIEEKIFKEMNWEKNITYNTKRSKFLDLFQSKQFH